MNTKREFRHHAESKHAQPKGIHGGGDFNANRASNKLKIKARRESGNRPEGNYEYEQMIAEDDGFGVHHMIKEAAFFIAMRRGFAPGNELGDWLQAETSVEALLHRKSIDRDDGDATVLKPPRAAIEG
jgi:hypothetical protein